MAGIKRDLAERFGVQLSRSSISRHVHCKFGMKCVRKSKAFKIVDANVERRKSFCEWASARLKLGGRRVVARTKTVDGLLLRHVVFSDEKIFRLAWRLAAAISKREQGDCSASQE